MNNSGFTLLEVVIALAIISLMGAAVTALSIQSQGAANSAVLKNQATKFAEEQLEQIRAYRDICGWDDLPDSGDYTAIALNSPTCDSTRDFISNGAACSDAHSGTLTAVYKNCFTMSDPSLADPSLVSTKQVISHIYYEDHGQQREVEISLYLADIR